MKLLFDNGNQLVCRHRANDLRLEGVFAVAQELLDSQAFIDPFEEELELLANLVKLFKGQQGQHKVASQKNQGIGTIGILKSYAPDVLRIRLAGVKAVMQYRLIADHPRRFVGWGGVKASGIEADFGSRQKEYVCLVHALGSRKVQTAPIHDIKGTSLDRHQVEQVDLVNLAVADVDKLWDNASQIQKGVELDFTLGATNRCPIEQTQVQVDCDGVKGIHSVLQVQVGQIGVAKEFVCSTNRQPSQIPQNPQVACFLGFNQRRATNAVAQPHRIQFVRVRTKRHIGIAKTLARGQFGECHHNFSAQVMRRTPALPTKRLTIRAKLVHGADRDLCKQSLADEYETSPRG